MLNNNNSIIRLRIMWFVVGRQPKVQCSYLIHNQELTPINEKISE